MSAKSVFASRHTRGGPVNFGVASFPRWEQNHTHEPLFVFITSIHHASFYSHPGPLDFEGVILPPPPCSPMKRIVRISDAAQGPPWRLHGLSFLRGVAHVSVEDGAWAVLSLASARPGRV